MDKEIIMIFLTLVLNIATFTSCQNYHMSWNYSSMFLTPIWMHVLLIRAKYFIKTFRTKAILVLTCHKSQELPNFIIMISTNAWVAFTIKILNNGNPGMMWSQCNCALGIKTLSRSLSSYVNEGEKPRVVNFGISHEHWMLW